MREDWTLTTIGEACRVVNGGTPKTKVPEYWDGDHQWITPAEMGGRSTPYVAETARALTDAGLQNSSARLLPPQSLILSSRAPIGYVVINTEPMAFNQGCKGLVPGEGFDHKFLYYYLTSNVDLLNSLGTGATFKELSGGKLKSVPLRRPSLSEQKRIVAILDEASAGIDATVANARKNLANADEVLASYLEACFLQMLHLWPEKELGAFSDRVSVGHVGSTSEFYCEEGSGIPFLRSQNVRPGALILSNLRYVTPEFHAQHSKSQLRPGDLLFVRVGANRGDCCSVPEGIGELNCANIVFARPRGQSVAYIEYYCQSRSGRNKLLGMTTGSAQGVINTRSVATLPVPLPPLQEQKRLVTGLTDVKVASDRLKKAYSEKLDDLADLRQSILQKAFSGELTAKEADREMAAA